VGQLSVVMALRHFAHSFLNITEVKKSEISPDFSTQSPLSLSRMETEQNKICKNC